MKQHGDNQNGGHASENFVEIWETIIECLNTFIEFLNTFIERRRSPLAQLQTQFSFILY